ncbi:transposase [Cuniculiplasma sp. SKW4]|uniref:transposase n=1 Tax=Cuniculiplasma sp. SKW4 TaxID=3400171 RepID=UPI003FD382BA
MDWHEINVGLIDLIDTGNENAAIDSFIVKTCKDSTAQKIGKSCKYKDPDSSWDYVTKGFQYGRKAHVSQDTDSTAILEWNITTASIHYITVTIEMIDSVRHHEYIIMDAAYDSSHIYGYVFENTHALLVIDKNKRRGILENNLTFNWKQGIILRKCEKSRYRLRWEIERTFSILEEILHCENIE